MFSNRQGSILNLLLSDKYIKIDEISNRLNLSSSTIKNEIKDIKNNLNVYKLSLDSKKGVGLKISGSSEDIKKLKDDIIFNSTSENNRIYEIAYLLLVSDKNTVNINELCNTFFISRSTLDKSYDDLSKYLASFGLTLNHIKGKSLYEIQGKEECIRKALASTIRSLNELDSYASQTTRINPWIKRNMDIDIDLLINKINKYLENMNVKYSDVVINTLAIHIAISIMRLRQDNKISIKPIKDIKYQDTYNRVISLTKEIGDIYGVVFNDKENTIIYSFLINTNNLLEASNELRNKENKEIAKEIIDLVNNVREINVDNEELVNALTLHLVTLSNRIENNEFLTNPLLEQIKTEYPDAFGLAYMCNSIFIRHFNKSLNEDEIGFIAIHIESMLEQTTERIKIVIVCSHGIGVSQLVASRIETRFSQINIVDTISEKDVNKYDTNIDLFITTLPIKTKTYSILVSPLLLSDDISRIESFINEYKKNIPSLLDSVCFSTLLNKSYKDQQEVFKVVEKHLQGLNIINDGFRQALVNRENIISTAIGNNTALPHVPEEYIKQSFIMIVTLKHKINWGNEKVDEVVVLGIKKSDFKRLSLKLRTFFRSLYDEQTHLKLLKLNNESKVKELINI